jgi:hypothetical protein
MRIFYVAKTKNLFEIFSSCVDERHSDQHHYAEATSGMLFPSTFRGIAGTMERAQ